MINSCYIDFYDPDGYYFDVDGYDEFGGHYDDRGYYHPGEGNKHEFEDFDDDEDELIKQFERGHQDDDDDDHHVQEAHEKLYKEFASRVVDDIEPEEYDYSPSKNEEEKKDRLEAHGSK